MCYRIHLNAAILDQVIQLKPQINDLALKLRERASKSVCCCFKEIWACMNGVSQPTLIDFVLIKVPELQEQIEEEFTELQQDFTLAMEELDTTQEARRDDLTS